MINILGQKRSKINNLSFYTKICKRNPNRRKIKIRIKINEINRKSIEKISKIKSWFLDKITTIKKPLAKVTNKRREKAQIVIMRNF